jgi:hypothetical protein
MMTTQLPVANLTPRIVVSLQLHEGQQRWEQALDQVITRVFSRPLAVDSQIKVSSFAGVALVEERCGAVDVNPTTAARGARPPNEEGARAPT